MDELYYVSLGELIDEFKFTVVTAPDNYRDIKISCANVNRPGLALAGFFDRFDPKRIQLIGNAEYQYIVSLDYETRKSRLDALFLHNPPAVVFTSDLVVFDEIKKIAQFRHVPVFSTSELTSALQAAMIASLSVYLAPRITRHGVLVEVYGEGILILGDSGIGKSETAIELVKRGHRLIADDAVEIKRVSAKTLVGSAPEVIRHYVELRGIGIIDVCRIFGMGAVKETEKIDMIIKLEAWSKENSYDRLGLEEETTEVLGIDVPITTIPVRPGRNLAIILEIAAMNNRQKKLGYNTAQEFNKNLMRRMGMEVPDDK